MGWCHIYKHLQIVLRLPVLEHGRELVLRGGERLGEVDPVEAPLARLQRDSAADQRHNLPVAHLGHQRHPRTRRVRRRERRRRRMRRGGCRPAGRVRRSGGVGRRQRGGRRISWSLRERGIFIRIQELGQLRSTEYELTLGAGFILIHPYAFPCCSFPSKMIRHPLRVR